MRRMQVLGVVTLAVMGAVCAAESYAYDRVFDAAERDGAWAETKRLSARMMIVRRYALKQSVLSDPVSDRYQVTCYGGSLDLVHFFMLAAEVCSGRKEAAPRLFQEWLAEGGAEAVANDAGQRFEAHPDDLPSNAFGALFGHELKARESDESVDLRDAFARFVRPMVPVPDDVARRYSHRQIVMGLADDDRSASARRARRRWFTAAPLLHLKTLNETAESKLGKPLCRHVETGEAALLAAGFRLVRYRGAPIVILRAE